MGRSFFVAVVLFACLSFMTIKKKGNSKIVINGTGQGTTYHITYYASDSIITKRQIDSILNRIDSSLSIYKPYSIVSQFNNSANGIVADNHFKKVVVKALDTYRQTNGLFDITVEPLTVIWGFGPDKINDMPDSAAIKLLLPCVNSRLLYWKGNTLMKKKACVKLDPNGIGQGYAVDVIADFFEQKEIYNYLVELGGEIRIKGRKPGNEKMSIGIEAPGDDADFSLIEKIVWLDNGAITTSGNYRRYYESKGEKISHLFNPKTGYSLHNELISVTVYAKDAMTADAYDNALMAMGLQKAMAFVEKRKDMAAHFIYRKKDGAIADTLSKRFYALLKP